MAGSRVAKIELKASSAGVAPGIRDASRQLRAFQREQSNGAKKAARDQAKAARDQAKADKEARKALKQSGDRGAGLAHSAIMGAGAAAGFDIAGVLGDAAHSAMDTEKELMRLGIDANLSAQQMSGFRDQILNVSNATGQSRLELVKAAHAYQILTGDAQGAMQVTGTFADVANASGASMEDIATAAASMRQNLALDPKDFRKGFDVLLNLGHKGALELRDFAGEMSGLAPQFKQFGGGDAVNQLTELGAALETVKLNFKDASETSTGLRAAMTAISKSKVADKLAAHGVDVWRIDPKTKEHVKRDFFDIIADIKKKIPDQKILADVLGGRQESFRAITAMLEHFDEMVKLRKEAANSDQVSVDAHRYMESASGRMSVAWERIKNAIASALTPERIEAFASVMERMAKFVGDAAGALGFLLNGPSKEAGTNMAAGAFVEGMNTGSQSDHEDAVRAAKRAQMPIDNDDPASIAYEQSMQGVYAVYGGRDNYQSGGRKALEAEGLMSGYQGESFGERVDGSSGFAAGLNHGGGAQGRAQLEASMQRAMTAALRDSFGKLGIVVKADANAIATTGKNAPINRGTQH